MSFSKHKILVVEDMFFNQVLLNSLLTDWGYNVVIAHDGKQGLTKLVKEEPNLIILDLMMPCMDGFQFLKEIQNTSNKTPVLIVTARHDAETEKECFRLGAKAFITKPMNTELLQKKIYEILSPQ